MSLLDLYEIAETENIEICSFDLPVTESMSIMDNEHNCYIGIDYNRVKSKTDEKRKLAHEIGHCIRGAFYNRYSKFDIISKHEYSADKWACENTMPKDEVEEAFKQGIVEVWQLAEYFDVTEELVKKAMWIYFDKVV